MKFYYNGKLMRTSKTHEYKFAAITEDGKCLCCSTTLDGCKRFLNAETNNGKGWLKNYQEIYKGTYKETKKGWKIKEIMKWFNNSMEELKKEIDRLEKYYNGIKIVELETRT